MSNRPKKIVGGLLAALLALFAAVVVATPAVASQASLLDTDANYSDLQTIADTLFPSPSGGGSVSVDANTNTIKVSGTVTISNQSKPIQLNIINLPSVTIALDNATVNYRNQVILSGAPVTINGSGTIQWATSVSNDSAKACLQIGAQGPSSLLAGTLTLDGNVTLENLSSGNTLSVFQGNATIGELAEVKNTGSGSNGTGAVQVGKSDATATGNSAVCTVDGEISGGTNGVVVVGLGQLVVNDTATITAGSGDAVDLVASANNANPTITVTGEPTIKGSANGIVAGYRGGDGNMTGTNPGGINDAAKATINISGDPSITGTSTTGVDNLLSSASVNISGGTITGGTDAFKSAATGGQVSGGLFSTPVVPSQLASSVTVMGVVNNEYGYYASEGDVPEDATATVPLTQSAATTYIVEMGVISTADSSGDNPIEASLKSLGLTSKNANDLLNAANTQGNNANVLYVVYYGYQGENSNTYTPQYKLGTGAYTNMSASGQSAVNGFNFGYLSLSGVGAGTANLAAGNYGIRINGGAGVYADGTINVAGLQYVYVAKDWTGVNDTEIVQGDLSTTGGATYYEVDPEAEPMPIVPADTLSSTPLVPSTAQNDTMFVGWYQVNGTGSSTTYTPYEGDEWTPTSATLTNLVAGYGPLPGEKVVTPSLTIEPDVVVGTVGGTATLTVDVAQSSKPGVVTLAMTTQPKKSVAPTLDQDAIVNGVVEILKDALASGEIKTSLPVSFVSNTSNEWESGSAGLTFDANKDLSVDGNTVTATIGFKPGNWGPYEFGLGANISGITKTGTNGTITGSPSNPTVSGLVATCTVVRGVKVTVYGQGVVNQTSDAQGNITLTAVPEDGNSFEGYTFNPAAINPSSSEVYYIQAAQVASYTEVIANFTGDTEPTPEDNIAVYRLYNTRTMEHLLSASTVEVASLTKGDWILDGYDANPSGIAFYELPATAQGIPVYRVYDPATDTHMYTSSVHEKDTLVSRGWVEDFGGQPMFMTPTTSSYKVYRLYNPSLALNISHLWTASWNEFNTLQNLPAPQKWDPEPNASGVAWYATGLPTGLNG